MTIRLLFAVLGTVLFLVACGPEAWQRDPQVRTAQKTCKEKDESERYTCIERHAVETLNPDICRLAGSWIDDMCLQAVYEAAADPAICDQLYLAGVRPSCRAYYSGTATPDIVPFRSDRFHFEVSMPAGWAVAEGPQRLVPPFTGVVAFNSWGEADFWAPALLEAGNSTYWALPALAQVPGDGAYVVLIYDYDLASRAQEYDLEHASQGLAGLWGPRDCREAGGATWLTFFKWGRFFRLEVYCPAYVPDVTAAAVDALIASWRFDRFFAGDPGCASTEARSLLPAETHPEWFPVVSGAFGDQSSLQASWERGIARRTTRAEVQNEIVSVTFMLQRQDPASDERGGDCPPDRCHWWRFAARPSGEVEQMAEGGLAVSLLPVKGTGFQYRDPSMGFAAEVPSDWEVGEHTDYQDPLGRSWSSVEFRSDLYPYGDQAFNRYGMRVHVGPSGGSTLTETVELSLSPLPPAFRDQVEMRCCLTVGGEQAIEILGYAPTRWGNRQIVVLHEESEYRLDFFPLAGLTTATPAGVEAEAAFETFLRTFSFMPITATPSLPAPTVTPVPTPGPPAAGS